ncbi:FecR domain-containing protein [soil metagenome]
MNSLKKTILCLASALFVSAIATGPVSAQTVGGGCVLEQTLLSARQVLRCGGGVTITAESGAQYTLLDRDGNGKADAANLRSKALLIDAPTGSLGKKGFAVTTPQAIAAVRGTRWAVDADGSKTSVFVATGRVSVRRTVGSGSVILGPGEGVDVEDTGPLIVKRWPAPRVAALMARLGQ